MGSDAAQDRRPPARGVVALALAATCLPLVVLLGAPVAVYGPNRPYFPGQPLDVLRPFLVALAAAAAVVALALALVPRRVVRVLRVVLPAMALAALVQTHVLVGWHGVLAGQTLDLRTGGVMDWLQVLPAVLLPALAFIYRDALQRHATFLAAVTVFWSVAGIAVDLTRHADDSTRAVSDGRVAWTRLVEASSSFNIFHIMADSFQGDAFQGLLDERPDLGQALPGFTFFADQAGYSNWTMLSFPVMWSGRHYFAEPFDKTTLMPRMVELLASGNVPALHARGYRANLLPPHPVMCFEGIEPCYTIFDDIKASARRSPPRIEVLGIPVRLSEESVFLADLALFRLLPAPSKGWAYDGGRWRLTNAWRQRAGLTSEILDGLLVERQLPISVRMIQRYITDLHVGIDQPAYHFVHLFPPHRPFILDDDCGVRGMSLEERRGQRENKDPELYRRQTRCAWKLIEQWLAKIKALGLYESSAIIIESDTGLGIVSPPPGAFDGFDPVVGMTQAEAMAYANPLLLVKPPNAKDPFRTSRAPTDHANSAATVRAWAGLGAAGERGFFDVPEGERRTRPFVISEPHSDRGVGRFHAFEIRGPVRDAASWVDVGTFTGFGEPVAAAPPPPRP